MSELGMTKPAGASLHRSPPMRPDPFQESDEHDGSRAEWMSQIWASQSSLLKPYHRTAEECVRMISGQQYILWSELWSRFIDITEVMSEDERTWRPRPVINKMLPWYLLTTGRMTENPPIVSFQPARPDRSDADLAEVWDIIHKREWRSGGAPSALEEVVRWMAATGEGYWKIRLNKNKGEIRRFEGPAMLRYTDPATGAVYETYADRVPYGPDGQPLAEMISPTEYEVTGEAHEEREGEVEWIPLSPFEVRSEWNHGVPFHRRAWHMHRAYLTPEQVYELYGVELDPDLRAADATQATEMRRLLYGTGSYSQVTPFSWEIDAGSTPSDLCTVDEMWIRPGPRHPEDEQSDVMGGRLLVKAGQDKVLYDGDRPFNFPYTSPIHRFPYISIPGRPAGSTPAEFLMPIQRLINRGARQQVEFRDLLANPKVIVDRDSGLSETERVNKPGEEMHLRLRPGVKPYEYVNAPTMSADAWRTQADLERLFDELGGLDGARGVPPTTDPSGKLVSELRFNSDRQFASVSKAMVEEIGRTAETLMAIVRRSWDREKVVNYVGEDNIHRTITVYPEMLKSGMVNVVPDVESMLPQSRSERQQQARIAYSEGLFGPPGTPEATRRYAETAKFPHPYRIAMPGETDRIMAQRELGFILQGGDVNEVPLFDWYDDHIHMETFEEYMKGPDFLKQDGPIQQAIVIHWQLHYMRVQEQQAMMQRRAVMEAATGIPGAEMEAADRGGGGGLPPGPTPPKKPLTPSSPDDD